MKQSEINSIMKKCYAASEDLSCEDALNISGYAGKTKRTGSSLFFECPNGCDRKAKLDKCAINVESNFAHCFCCGEGWNAVKLMASIWDVPYNRAALMYGQSVGAIDDALYEEIIGNEGNLAKAMKGTAPVKKAEQKAIEESDFKRPAKHLDLVYRHLLMMSSFALSDAHREYLQKTRQLSNADIQSVGFFSYEETFSMAQLTASIQREVPTFNPKEDYWGVPGFFFQFADETKSVGKWTFHKPYFDCIGIPIRDEEERIIALQMRALSDKASVKYFFVSSKTREENTGYGSTPSTPCAVLYPPEISSSYVYIGEGVFKMMEIAKREGAISVSVQGVNNTKDVPETLKNALLCENSWNRAAEHIKGKHRKMHIIIAFDADLYKNHGVIEASRSLVKGLRKTFPAVDVSFLCWDLNLGKGIDDLIHYAQSINVDYHSLCRVFPAETILSLADFCYAKIGGGKKPPKKVLVSPEFAEQLYDAMWTSNLSQFF